MRDMKGTIKKFNIQSHRVNDKKGKVFALQILNQSQVLIQKLGLENCNFIENENRYGIDLLAINNNNEIIAAFVWQGTSPGRPWRSGPQRLRRRRGSTRYRCCPHSSADGRHRTRVVAAHRPCVGRSG